MIERLCQKAGADYSSPIEVNLARNVAGIAYGSQSDRNVFFANSRLTL